MLHDHFNSLNPEHHEILTKIAEESSEVVQAICKTLLHGIESTEPNQLWSNREKIQNELGDLMFFIGLAVQRGILSQREIQRAYDRRASRSNHYLHHTEVD